MTIAPLDGDQPKSSWARLAGMGVRHVQLSATQPGMRPRELDRSSRRGLRADLQRREMIVSGIDLWIPPAHLVEPEHIDRAVAAVLGAIELAGDLGRCPLSIALPHPGEDADGESEVLATIAAHAERFGVMIANHALDAMSANAPQSIGVGIDPPTLLAAQEDPAARVAQAGDRLVAARLCDLLLTGTRGPVGDPADGRLDVLAYRVALSVAGFAGPVVIDARQWSDAWGGLKRSVRAWEGGGIGQ